MSLIDIENIEQKELIPGYKVRFVHSDNMTLAFWDIKAGYSLPKHKHEHEQISLVTEGEFELTVDNKAYILKPGKLFIIPSNAYHSGKAITDCLITDTFWPLREDYQ